MIQRKLIEVSLPVDRLNVAAQKDKNPFLKGHPRSLHLWWSRKPLAVCRAILFASLIDDPSSRPEEFPNVAEQDRERKRLLKILDTLIDANQSEKGALREAIAEIRRQTNGKPPAVFDPFAGGGSIPLEAKRLGLEAHGSDINPLAVIINKALIEIPEKFYQQDNLLPETIRRYGKWIQEEARKRLLSLYPDIEANEVIAWLYCRSVSCIHCSADLPLISKFWLCTKKGKQAWLKPEIENNSLRLTIVEGPADESLRARLNAGTRVIQESGKIAKGAFACLTCGNTVKGKYIDEQAERGALGFYPLAVVAQVKRGRRYLPFSLEQMRDSLSLSKSLLAEYQKTSTLPEQQSRGTFASNAQGRSYGIKTFSDYFLPRQLMSLCVISDLVEEARLKCIDDPTITLPADERQLNEGGCGRRAFSDAVATYLAFAVNHMVRYSTLLNPWNTTNQNVAQIFGRQAMVMTWDFAESNIVDGPLSMVTACEWVASAVKSLPLGQHGSSVRQQNAVFDIDKSLSPLVITDPPYYDYVSYADLSDFFYVWLKRSLSLVHSGLFNSELAPKDEELVVTPHRFDGDNQRARRHFVDGLTRSFAGLRKSANVNFPLAVFYAFNPKEIKQLSQSGGRSFDFAGWEAMLESLISSGWMLTAYWTLATEKSTRMVARGTRALPSSLLLILRRRPDTAASILKDDLVHKLDEGMRFSGDGIDNLQMSLLEGTKILTQYAAVLDADGQKMSIGDTLKIVVAQVFLKVK